MKVILTKDVSGLGKAGAIVNVSEGYGRNYLIRNGLALPATESALKQAQQLQQARAKKEKRLYTEASELANALNQLTLVFKARVGAKDRLYGSITSADIAEQITERLHTEIDKRKIMLEQPIRELGTHKVTVKLMPNVTAEVTVVVEKEEEGE